MMGVGSALILMVWAVEWSTGLINPWDRWMMPLLATSIAALAVLQHRQPQLGRWVRLGAVLLFNLYLSFNFLVHLWLGGEQPNQYQMMTVLYWLPLAYGLGFVFLPPRWALALAIGIFALNFAPIAVLALAGAAPSRWPQTFATLVVVLAAAQVAYIVLLRSVASVRANYHLAQERMELMQRLAGTDVLTGLPNRRAMLEHLHAALALSQRQGQPVVVALFDVDHFKRINDQHGHGAGDRALVQVAQVLASQLRASDHLGRWGGEEFLLVAPNTPMHAGQELVERLRRAVAAQAFDHAEPVTVSVGLSQHLKGDDPDTLLNRADRALYRAKEMGRNRTEAVSVAAAP